MLARLLGGTTPSRTLRTGLDETASGLRGIAHRVASGSSLEEGGFHDVFGRVQQGEGGSSLEDEMILLADGQLRFEAATRILQKVYQGIRTSVGGGGR